jgi:hypothetical protein
MALRARICGPLGMVSSLCEKREDRRVAALTEKIG